MLHRRFLRVALSHAALLACAMAAGVSWAQTDIADVPAYREARRAATALFLDRSADRTARLAAAAKLGYPDEETFSSLLRIGQDRTEDDAIRLQALRRHRYDPNYVAVVLKILADPDDGGEELDAVLIDDLSRRASRNTPSETLQQMLSVLRDRRGDSRPKVRLFAYRALIGFHDPAAAESLAESLRRGREFPIPLADAVDLLDRDGPIKHIVTLRPYLNNPDPAVRASVARSLAVDPQSRNRVVSFATNRQVEDSVRIAALRGLASQDERFVAYATTVMEDARSDPTVREAAMSAIAGRFNYRKPTDNELQSFSRSVQKLANRVQPLAAQPDPITEKAREMVQFLRQSFPESGP